MYQDVFILCPTVTFWSFFTDVHFSLSIVPSRDLVAPPELTRDDPVVDIFHPLEEGIIETRWVEFYLVLCVLVGNSILANWSILTNHCVDKRGSTTTPVRSE